MRATTTIALSLALLACGPAGKQADAPAPQPSQAARETFANCMWGEVKGQTISMWSFTCAPDAGGMHLVADDGLQGFVLESTDSARPGRRVVVRLFDKPADAPIEAVLGAVRAISPGLNTPTCAFEPATGVDHAGRERYVLTPTGAAKAAYEAAVGGDAMPGQPCGPLGVSPAGDRFFAVAPGRPDKVMFIDRGSEIQIFDEQTLRVHAP